jgi:hypothetical protein
MVDIPTSMASEGSHVSPSFLARRPVVVTYDLNRHALLHRLARQKVDPAPTREALDRTVRHGRRRIQQVHQQCTTSSGIDLYTYSSPLLPDVCGTHLMFMKLGQCSPHAWLSREERRVCSPARIAGCSRPISRAALLVQRCQTRPLCTMRSVSFVVC